MSEISEFLKYTPKENDQVITHKGVEFVVQEVCDCTGCVFEYDSFYNNRLLIAHSTFELCVTATQEWIDEHPAYARTQNRKKAFRNRLATNHLRELEQKVFNYFSSNIDKPINATMISEDLMINGGSVRDTITNLKSVGLVRKTNIPTCYVFVKTD